MTTPEQIDFMAFSVSPVIAKINQNKKNDNCVDVGRNIPDGQVFVDKLVDTYAENFEEDSCELLGDAARNIGDSIVESVLPCFTELLYQKFDSNQKKVNWN